MAFVYKKKGNRAAKLSIRKRTLLRHGAQKRLCVSVDGQSQCLTLVVPCYWCKTHIFGQLITIDHLKPRSEGGTDDDDNLVPACERCNCSRKSTAAPPGIN